MNKNMWPIILYSTMAICWIVLGVMVAAGTQINFRLCYPLAAFIIALADIKEVIHYWSE